MNKALRILVSSYLLIGICNAGLANDQQPQADDDHLIPIDGRIELPYEKLLDRRLFVTPANYGRIVILASPASVGELAIAIYSKRSIADEVWITATRAERNLWAAEFGEDPSFPKIPAVQVSRCDALFPKSTSAAVSSAIKRMVKESRPLSKNGRIIVDATDIVFAVQDREEKGMRALLTPEAQGKNTAALRRLVRLLESYCGAKPSTQQSLSKKIETEAKSLTR